MKPSPPWERLLACRAALVNRPILRPHMTKMPTVSFMARDGKSKITGVEMWRGLCPITGKPVVTVAVDQPHVVLGPLGRDVSITSYQDVPEKYIL